MDAAHEAADDALDAFSERVRAIYSQAYGEAAALLEKHLEGYAEGVADMRGRVERGEMTDDEFRRWRTGKALEGSRFQALCGQMAECVAHADELGREVVGGTLPDVYAENVLFAAYSIESQAGRLFTAVSADALQQLLRGDDLMPPLKDATEWARRHVSQAVTQGVLLGESVPRISKRLEDAVDMSRRAAVRTARTAVTSAENAGRKAACDRAASMGARVTRRWMATLDGRTRDSHRALDGERVGEDGKFSNGLRFPGDPAGRPGEFYNCRCTTVPEVRGHDVFGERWERLPEGTTYEEWKRGVGAVADDRPPVAETVEEAREIAKMFVGPSMGTKFKGDVVYKGLSVETANQVNAALWRAYREVHDLPKLGGIKVISPTSAQGKKAFKDGADAMAAYDFAERGVFINKDALKSIETFEAKAREAREAFEFVIANKGRLSGSRLEVAERYERAGRALVDGSTIEGVILHELGHHVDWALVSAKGDGVRRRMREFCDGISGYAGSDPREYMAESFVAFMRGETAKLDPEYASLLGSKPASSTPSAGGSAMLSGVGGELKKRRILLPPDEYAKVTSEINTVYHARFEGKKVDTIVIDQDDGAYAYTFVIDGFDEYTVIEKERID